MKNVIFPALVVLATVGTIAAMTRAPEHHEDEQAAHKLPVSEAEVAQLTPFLQAAARDLGHTRVRAYESGVFIDLGDDQISFFKEKGALTMHVGMETKYRHQKKERTAQVKALQLKGESIYQHALSLQARHEAQQQMASRDASRPAG